MAKAGEKELSDKELLKVSDLLNPEHILKFAIEFIDLGKTDFDQANANSRTKTNPTLELKLELLTKWKHKKGKHGTRKVLYDILVKASENDGLIDRSKLDFLLKPDVEGQEGGPPTLKPIGKPAYQNTKKKAKVDLPGNLLVELPQGQNEGQNHGQFTRGRSQSEIVRKVTDLTLTEPTQGHTAEEAATAAAAAAAAYQTQTIGTVDVKLYDYSKARQDDVNLYQSKQVSMKHKITFGTDLMNWEGTKFCRMTTENTIIFGKKKVDPTSKGPGIYVYNSEGKKKKRLEDVCEHTEMKKGDIISLEVDKYEYVLIICVQCKKMFLLNIESGKYYLSYENNDITLGPVCKGEPSEIYVVAKRQEQTTQSIFILNCSNKRFTSKKIIETKVTKDVALAAYVSSASCLLLLERETNITSALSVKTGEKQWQLDGNVMGAPYIPKCLVTYSRRHDSGSYDVVVAADGSDKLIVFSTQDGKYKHELSQTKFKDINTIQCVGDTLVVLQSRENAVAICFYKIKYEIESSV